MKRTPLKKPKFKKCPICKEKKQPFPGTVCSYECSIKYMEAKKQKAWTKEKSERRDKLKTHSDWSKELQDLVNEIARLIDKGAPCISCQKSTGSQRHGGHRWRTSTYPEIRFHLDNVASQCAYCNDYLSGNSDGYDYGLLEFYGGAYLNWVHSGIREAFKSTKLTIPELIEAKARAKKIVRSLRLANTTYGPKIRILLRKKYNKKLGIYND